MKRVEDFNEFLSDHVNINQSRLDKLNRPCGGRDNAFEPALGVV